MAYRIEQTGTELQGILNDAAVTKQGLEDEVARAQAAEGVLQENIDSEAGERQSADALLAGNIGTEVARAQQAESDLGVRVDANAAGVAAEVARAQEAEGQVWDTLNDEILTRQSQDAALQVNIEREAGLREAGDGQLQGEIYAISEKIPAEASEMNQLADKQYVQEAIEGTPTREEVAAIEAVIPAAASENNKLVDTATFEAAIDGKQDTLTFDEEPTEGSENPVTSGGVASAVATLQGLYAELRDGKADKATTLAGYGIEDAYTKGAVDEMIGALSRNEIVVGALPQTGEEGVIYRVPGNGYYTDYMYYNGEFVELSQYSMEFDQTQVGYFTCDTAAGTAAKTVSAAGYTLAVGGSMHIKMTNANTAANATLNINGTGAKALFYNDGQASASNSWEAGEVVTVFYDGTRFVASNSQGGGGKCYRYEQIPVTWISDHYVNASNNLVELNGFSAVQNIDISGFSKIIASVRNEASAAKHVILDENYNVLNAATRTMPQIDLASYPTAKYMSFTNQGYTYSGIIYGVKEEDASIQDMFADYLEFGTDEDNYVRSIGKEIFVFPKIAEGLTYTTGNAPTEQYSSGKSTDYGVVPVGATKIYYTGWSYSAIAGVLFYDKYKNLISAGNGGVNAYVTDKEFTIPEGTVYYRCCSMESKLSYYFDNMPQVVLGGESGHVTTLQEISVPLTGGGYVDASDNVGSLQDCYYAKDVDISEYAGKKLVIMCNASVSSSRNLLLDDEYNILLSYRNLRESVDLAQYPTAKYLSVSNYIGYGDIKYSGKVFVVVEAEETETEILNGYYEVYGSGSPAYAKMITDKYYIEPNADVVDYYLSNKGMPVSYSGGRYTSEYYLVPSSATILYYTGVSLGSAPGVLFYDKYKNMIKAVTVGSSTTPVTNAEVPIQEGSVYYRLSSMSAACSAHFDNPTIPVGGSGGSSDLSNYLSRKKYVAIGDSFTDYRGSEVIEEGPLAGLVKSYPNIIANRNNMTILNQSRSGTVLNWYLSQGMYNNIPQDVDYVTIWYGINDQAYSISVGTVDDQPESVTSETSTSTCGGFNWFFKWLCTNRPYAKVGCIITDYTSAERRAAIIGCCKKWGIAYLDIMGDPTIPMFPGGRNSDIAVSADAVSLKQQFFNVEAGNIHPNVKCHEWQSTIIEHFMRSL